MAQSLPCQSPSTGDTDPIFDKAVAKFKKGLTKDQAQIFAGCTLDDVKNEIKDIQNRHGSQRRLRNMERLSKFVEGMDQLGKVVEVFLNLHNTVALIWGPLKFLLLTAKTSIDTLESLLDVYAQVGEVLPDLTRYGQIFKEYPAVHTHLESYYCDILQFHSNALEVFSRPCWKVLFHSAWKTFKTQFDPILRSLQRHRDMLSEEKLTAVMEETQKQGQSIQEKLHQLSKELGERDKKNAERDLIDYQSRIDQQKRTVESKIDAPSYHEDYEIASQKRFAATSGRWILNHSPIVEWLDHSSNASGKIYLSGIPGAGKTVLTSSIISHLKERKSSSNDFVDRFSISYFFFKHDQPKKNSLVSLLRALLAQLVGQDISLLDHVYQACCSAESQQFRSMDEVSRHVSMALQSQSRCFVVIDGLDECSEASRDLQWFESLMSKKDSTSGNTDSSIRLFISGQRDGILEQKMSQYTRIDLDKSFGHEQDIEGFANTMAGKIRDKFSLDYTVEQDIASRVTSQAGGMFLYAQLVLNNLLSQTSKYDLKQELKAETFPEGLEQAYERVIIRVLRNPNKAESTAAKHILGTIICACRPLHWREIQSKFCIDPLEGEADIDRQLVMSCKQICSSLVEVSYLEPSSLGEETVHLVHSSAQVYLVQTEEIHVPTENAKMALFCAEYMISRPMTPGLSKAEMQDYAMTGYYGFHDYASAFWWKHVQQVLTASEMDTGIARKVLQTAHEYLTRTGEIEENTAVDDDSSGAIQSLKRKLERIPQDLRDWTSIKIYELRLVVIREALEVLVNQPREHRVAGLALYGPWRYKCRKPWCQYFNHGFEDAQQQQLHNDKHELPFTCDYHGCVAAEFGFEKESDLRTHTRRWHPLEEPLPFPMPKQHTKSHPNIFKAVETGDLETVKYHIQQGNISPDYQKKGGKCLLQSAVEKGQLHIVQYLKEMGANMVVESRPNTPFGSLLKIAVACEDLEMVAFLSDLYNFSDTWALRRCTDMVPFPRSIMAQLIRNASPEDQQDILSYAIESRNATAVSYFAETLDASYFDNTLMVAVKSRHLPSVDVLLASGKVDPNVHSSKGHALLHDTCKFWTLPIFQRLYAVTTTTNSKDAFGNTLLHLASKFGHDAIVEFLIKEGADVNAKNLSSETPLQLASTWDRGVVVKLLIDNGAIWDPVDNVADKSHNAGGIELSNPIELGGILDEFDFNGYLKGSWEAGPSVVDLGDTFPVE
ncbi:hypothetical protein FPOAC2_03877 [Fusarium poae]|uniref:hypothetical protein n=1 Tax=Fusarium poae TaxID=36050 RepID=UPI001CEA904D|nr:hypothetical protein FPOAC1_003724 [Fusarium poae]KAG8677696.1 hypothetical protein FPOAC1_003724 [Fusarium poae]